MGKLPPGTAGAIVQAWPRGPRERQPGNSETTREPANESRKAAALGSWPDHNGERKPENAKAARPAGERRQRTPETPGGWLALLSKRDRMARGNARDCQRTGERKQGNIAPWPRFRQNAGNCWRYRPGVTAWPWGSCQPGNSETARTPGTPGDCWRYRSSVTAWPGGAILRD